MTFVSIVAAASTQPDTGTPAWLVPVITGAVGLFGTIVGGTLSFISTRSADKRKEAAEAKRQRIGQIKDVSVRFLRALSKQSIDSIKFRESAEDLHQEFEAMITSLNELEGEPPKKDPTAEEGTTTEEETTTTRSDSEKLRAAKEEVRARKAKALAMTEDLLRRAALARDVNKGLGAIDEAVTVETDALLAEMSLILPNSTVRKAEKAAVAVLNNLVTAYLPADQRPDRSIARDATHDFISDIRSQMGFDHFEPSSLDEVGFSTEFLDNILKKNESAAAKDASSAGQS